MPPRGPRTVAAAEQLEEFRWFRAASHAIAIGNLPDGSSEQVVMANDSIGRTEHDLAERPELFQTFAILEATPAGVLAFANSHGLLGVSRYDYVSVDIEGEEVDWVAEPIDVWYFHSKRLAAALELWRVSTSEPPPRNIREIVQGWIRAAVFGDDLGSERDAEALEQDYFVRRNYKLAASRLLARAISSQTAGCSPAVVVTGAGDFRLRLRPTTLLDAMWLQLAVAVTGDVKHRQCLNCGKWMQISLRHFRRNRVTCSGACRTKWSRAVKTRGRTRKPKRSAGK
jgi:hypothetical protein